MTIRLLGVQIANGYSSEANVFAGLLAGQDPGGLEARVLCNQWSGDQESVLRFRRRTEAAAPPPEIVPMDFGWRSMAPGRSLWEKTRPRLQFHAALPRAAAAGREPAPTVVYSSQQLWDCTAATYIARRLNKPQIIHLHYIIGPWLHPPVLNRLRACEHVVTVSDFIREEALRHGVLPERVTTIRNGIPVGPPPAPEVRREVRHELGILPDAPLLGMIARLDPDKGQADTLRAFVQVRARHPSARLLVAGGETPWYPGYAETLKTLASELGLGDAVLFLGPRSDVPRLLASLDVFVHPSRQDPCPLALLEASAAALPVVAYAEGGALEIVEHGQTGLLGSPAGIEELSSNLSTLLDDPQQALRLGEAGRDRMAAQFQPSDKSRQFHAVLAAFAPSRRSE